MIMLKKEEEHSGIFVELNAIICVVSWRWYSLSEDLAPLYGVRSVGVRVTFVAVLTVP